MSIATILAYATTLAYILYTTQHDTTRIEEQDKHLATTPQIHSFITISLVTILFLLLIGK